MTKYNKIQKKILKLITSSSNQKLDIYTLFRRSRINYNDFFKAIRKLIDKNVIEEADNYVFVVYEDIIKNRETILKQQDEKIWRKIPKEFLDNSMSVNSFYIPSRALLDKRSFNVNKNSV